MSPEQISNSDIDQQTDIWSLGVILYEMLTNQIPFQDSYDQAVMYSIINEDPKAITAVNPDVPVELERIVNKMLNKNPADRFEQVSDLLMDLESYKKYKNIPAGPLKILKSIYSTKNRIWFYLITAFLFIVVASSIAYYAIIRTPRVPSIGILNMENLGGSEDDFWSRGITEDLIINVASAGVIRVPTINEVNKYKRSDFTMTEIAEKLRVDYLLFSSFFKADSVFDLWCRIIDPKSGKDIFAKKWTKPIKNVSTITTILAGSVLSNLGISIKKSPKIPVIVNPDAYELYLRGKHVWETRKNQSDNNLARGLLNKALEKDPNFMQAKIQLGKIYYDVADHDQAFEIFSECLEYAKDINDESTIAIAMLNIGTYHLSLYQFTQATENYEKALKIVRKQDDKYNESKLLRSFGNLYYMQNDYEKAEEYWEESRLLSVMLGDQRV
jgi:serine/threonine protein kinase